jgi:hypothetical protein
MLPSVRALERAMGYTAGKTPGYITALIEEVYEELRPLEEIRAEYLVFDDIEIDPDGGTLRLQEVIFNAGRNVSGQIREAEKVALFVCTAGATISDRSRCRTPEGDLLSAYIHDVTGTMVVEKAAARIVQELRRTMEARGYGITGSFSPGCCGWDLAEQRKLFSFFRDNYCGVILTESALMKPVKSVSGLTGMGKNVSHHPWECHLCNDRYCIYRGRKAEGP